jgi:hypothetical protein
MESVFLTSENRNIATVNIPGAFLQANMDETEHIKLVGTMVDILLRLNTTKYEAYITYEHIKKVLNVRLNKALFGKLRAALLFWKNSQRNYRSENSPSIRMIGVLQINILTDLNAQLFGMLTI